MKYAIEGAYGAYKLHSSLRKLTIHTAKRSRVMTFSHPGSKIHATVKRAKSRALSGIFMVQGWKSKVHSQANMVRMTSHEKMYSALKAATSMVVSGLIKVKAHQAKGMKGMHMVKAHSRKHSRDGRRRGHR